MENYFATKFEAGRHERSLVILISLTDPDIIKQAGFLEHEIKFIKILLWRNYIDRNH